MSELLAEISREARSFIDEQHNYVERRLSRIAIMNVEGVEIEIEQIKFLTSEEVDQLRSDGPTAITEPYWDGEGEIEAAGEDLLLTALQLVREL